MSQNGQAHFENLEIFVQDFKSLPDQFEMLCNKGLKLNPTQPAFSNRS